MRNMISFKEEQLDDLQEELKSSTNSKSTNAKVKQSQDNKFIDRQYFNTKPNNNELSKSESKPIYVKKNNVIGENERLNQENRSQI